ncbi:MarR family transcriptional regulator [Rathayibacter sp. YIM 133350]|uniref:MarR family winged helix-turn-helix transcriptional regulator n=1 Tax=Rathayibacter sp. YIM 133350 TaxID=3131992 RepID=UPI00307F8754
MSTGTDARDEGVAYWYDVEDGETTAAITVLEAMRRFRAADRLMRVRTQGDMDMGETDLAALRFIIAAEKNGTSVGPTDLARHLAISTAATAKLVTRLVASGHLRRQPHPSDGRALVLTTTDSSHEEVRKRLGPMHRRMLEVAETLTPDERVIVGRFLSAMADAVTVHDDR